MNTVKGSFYVLFQSYKKKNIIFWSILFSIVLLSFFLDTFFGKYIPLSSRFLYLSIFFIVRWALKY
ncbi:hypothetical protein ABIA69_000197 [Lysinibacillus parviboronicapiens]|uniref:Uncharacterized protein n=1 Tax=Lysinibacillus parviboronicapiens TaxID=436516 RepID=A0ABV2PEH7_9BACI